MTYQSLVQATAAAGLHRYYRFEGATAGVRDDDYSSNVIDCAFTSGPTFPAGVVGQGIEVGVSGSYCSFGFVKAGATGFAFATWYKNQGGTVIWRDGSTAGGWLMLIAGADVTLRINGTNRTIAGLGTILSSGAWYFVAVRSTGTTVETYIGTTTTPPTLVDTFSQTVNASTLSGSVFYLGRNGGNVDTHHGSYDEPALWLTTIPTGAQLIAIGSYPVPPGVPTSVANTGATTTTLDLSWAAPSTGGPVSSYETRIDGGAAGAATSPKTFTGLAAGSSHTLEVRAVGTGGNSAWVGVTVSTVVSAPGVPTAVSVTAIDYTELELSWGAPASGGAVDHYEVRRDGGAGSTATSPHVFDSLTPTTSYLLEVRAVNAGGASAWVGVTESTLELPAGWYRVDLELGPLSWSIERFDPPDYGPLLPLSMGWQLSETDFFPSAPESTVVNFQVLTPDASTLAEVVKGTTVTLRMYLDPAPDADPWQSFDGVVTQLDGEVVKSSTDPDAFDFIATVFAGDDNARLADMFVGYSTDWPIEHINERAERIATEAGIGTFEDEWDGGVGWLDERVAGNAVSALSALSDTYKDAAEDYNSEFPLEFYGRPVVQYVHAEDTLYVRPIRRRVFPSGFGGTTTLSGDLVLAEGSWTKQPGPHAATWGIVDGATFGTPDGTVPFVRNTSLLDYFGDPPGSDTNYSSFERDALGESLLADGSTALDGWSTRRIRYEAHLDPEPVFQWGNLYRYGIALHPVVVTPISAELELNGVDYLAGTLTGARLVIPAGGDYYVEATLRAELLPGTDLP